MDGLSKETFVVVDKMSLEHSLVRQLRRMNTFPSRLLKSKFGIAFKRSLCTDSFMC